MIWYDMSWFYIFLWISELQLDHHILITWSLGSRPPHLIMGPFWWDHPPPWAKWGRSRMGQSLGLLLWDDEAGARSLESSGWLLSTNFGCKTGLLPIRYMIDSQSGRENGGVLPMFFTARHRCTGLLMETFWLINATGTLDLGTNLGNRLAP